jgi:hypothetical protein
MTLVLEAVYIGIGFSQASVIYDPKANRPVDAKQSVPPSVVLMRQLIENGIPNSRAGTVQLHRMGDQAALTVISIVGTERLIPKQISNVLDIIHVAFELYASIDLSSREPRATSVLLQLLGTETDNPDLKERIASTQAYVASVAAKNRIQK